MGYGNDLKYDTRGWSNYCFNGTHSKCKNTDGNCLCPHHYGIEMRAKTKGKKSPTTTHWACKFCQILNHNVRTKCLGCDRPRKKCEAYEHLEHKIRTYWHVKKK